MTKPIGGKEPPPLSSWIFSGLAVVLSLGWVAYSTPTENWMFLYLTGIILAVLFYAIWHMYLRHQDFGKNVNPNHLAQMLSYLGWFFSMFQWMRFKTYSAVQLTNPEEMPQSAINASLNGMLFGAIVFIAFGLAAFAIKWNMDLLSSPKKS